MNRTFPGLIRRAQRGNQQAMNELLERVYPRVRDFVHRRLERNRRESFHRMLATYTTGDVVQDVFIKVVTQIDRFGGDDEDTLINYLAVLVRNTVSDRLRHYAADRRNSRCVAADPTPSRQVVAVLASGEPSPLNRVSAQERIGAYRSVLQLFSERERRLLQMRIEGTATFAILARELRYSSEDAARKAYHAARALLLVRLRARGIRS